VAGGIVATRLKGDHVVGLALYSHGTGGSHFDMLKSSDDE
jgi:hypothetical protein